jgi:hypothetical protein
MSNSWERYDREDEFVEDSAMKEEGFC